MANKSEFLTKDEKALCEEILRVSVALKKSSLALTGDQFRMFQRMKGKAEYRGQYDNRLSHLELYSVDVRRAYRKKDNEDMFV